MASQMGRPSREREIAKFFSIPVERVRQVFPGMSRRFEKGLKKLAQRHPAFATTLDALEAAKERRCRGTNRSTSAAGWRMEDLDEAGLTLESASGVCHTKRSASL